MSKKHKREDEATEQEKMSSEEETLEKEAEDINADTEEAKVKEESQTKEDEALNTRFMRLSADFANYKKRVEKEKSDIYRLANERLMGELLPVIDNMDRALEHAEESSKESFIEGVQMVFKNFMSILEGSGLKEIKSEGEPFDHNQHHAVLTEPSDEHESDMVIGVLQKGYTLNDKVIRPSMVKVSS